MDDKKHQRAVRQEHDDRQRLAKLHHKGDTMNKVTIIIETDNAAFHPDKSKELHRILAELTDRIRDGLFSIHCNRYVLSDVNGNVVGYVTLS